MTDLEHRLDSSNHCSNQMISKHSDSSTNACLRTNVVLITAAPLCEMVWSQQKGLSLKYAPSSLAEKKASLLWSTESFDKIAWRHFPHQGEASDDRDASVCKLSSVQLESHVQNKDSCKVTLLSSPRSVNGSCGEMQYFLNKDGQEAKGEPEIDGDCDGKEHDMHLPFHIGCQLNVFKPETNFINEQDLNTDAHNLPARQTLFERSEEFTRMCNHDSPCLNVVPSTQDTVLAKGTATAILNSQSISRSTEGGSNMDITRACIEQKEMKLPHRNWLGLFAYTDNSYANESENRKCKEPIMSNVDDNGSTSNRRKDGRDHIDYVSSQEMRLILKRTRGSESEQEKCTIGKRLKSHGSGGWSTSLTRQGESSFMNWVAAITNGLIGPSQVMPLKLVQHPGQSVTRGSALREDKVDVRFSQESKGFKSIFQAMYHHGSNTGSSKVNYIGKKAELVALNGPWKVEKRNDVSCCVHQERLEFDSHSCVAAAQLTFGNLDKEEICNETVNFGNVGLAPQDDSTNSYDNVLAIQKSLWVARLSRKLTSPKLESMQCSNYADLAVQKSHDGADHNLHCEKVHTTVENKQAQYNSERIEIDEHEGSKQFPSILAKRLGSLEHCKTLGFADDGIHANKICFYCGMNNHSVKCSDAVVIRRKDYLKSMPVCNKIRNASCFCLQRFQIDQWTSAYSNLSSKRSNFSNNATGTMDKNRQSRSFTTDDEAIVLLSRDVQRDYKFIHESSAPQKESIEAKTDLFICSKLCCYKNESADHCRNDLHMNGTEDTTNAKKVKDTPLCFWKNKFLDCPPSYESKGIFLAVRKLRLSRTDITRLMKSSKHFSIDGFFLRLRLGKPEKGLGGTGYHVACINGSSSRSSISVCVGTSTYTVRSRFISNHDFDEHELKAWWLGKLRDGGRRPSKEELNEKIQLRLKLGF